MSLAASTDDALWHMLRDKRTREAATKELIRRALLPCPEMAKLKPKPITYRLSWLG